MKQTRKVILVAALTIISPPSSYALPNYGSYFALFTFNIDNRGSQILSSADEGPYFDYSNGKPFISDAALSSNNRHVGGVAFINGGRRCGSSRDYWTPKYCYPGTAANRAV